MRAAINGEPVQIPPGWLVAYSLQHHGVPQGCQATEALQTIGLPGGGNVAGLQPSLQEHTCQVLVQASPKGKIDPGEVAHGQNLFNLLRLAVLYKFGGIYIDTDVLVMKSFLGLKNVIEAQAVDAETGNWSRLNNAVMIFDRRHSLLYKFIKEFALTFDGNKWGHNGPYLVSRVVSRVIGKPGFMFTLLPPVAFYPVDWNRIEGLFQDGNHSKWVMAKLDRRRLCRAPMEQAE